MELIDKDAVMAEIERIENKFSESPDGNFDELENQGANRALDMLEYFINTLEVKEVDLEKEIELIKGDYEQFDVAWNNDFDFIARHFFELGLKVNNPTTAADRGIAEEIIVNLKRIEQDYCINLTKEMQWLRDIVKKGE